MNPKIKKRLLRLFSTFATPRWKGSVASWCEQNLIFNEPKLSGPFSFSGREYMREPLDCWGDDGVRDIITCWGTRTGKTRIVFGGIGWRIRHSPTRVLWVMPNTDGTGGARNVSRTRFQPMIYSSPTLARYIPSGNRRWDFKTLQMIVNGSIIDMTGSNSPANLAGNPCDTVVQDETDKMQQKGESEAHPSALADQRCKEFSTPKRFKSSTPTLVSGLIWQEFLKSDQRRRFMPCPHCNKEVILAWSERFTVLPKIGVEAYCKWDDGAKKGGVWDLAVVEATAHYECPHCGGWILEHHKKDMDKKGVWKPTNPNGVPGYRGYHLPSMYSSSRETTAGRMASRFLVAKESLLGLQDFINSDLAEPYVNQDTLGKRVEMITSKTSLVDGHSRIMTVDCQAKSPYFWFVVRGWCGADSELISAGSCDDWADIEAVQKFHKVRDVGVFIDSGFGAKSDAEVYRVCAQHGEICRQDKTYKGHATFGLPVSVGWNPCKGFEESKRWKETETGLMLPYTLRSTDPYLGTSDAGKLMINLLEFSAEFFKDILASLRAGKGGFKWTVCDTSFRQVIGENVTSCAMDIYWRHMDGQVKAMVQNKFTGKVSYQWVRRNKHWPDHMYACEYMQIAAASLLGLLPVESKPVDRK